MRNVLHRISPRDKKAVSEDLIEVFNNFESNATFAKAKEKMASFCKKWEASYPSIKNSLIEEEADDYFAYVTYPHKVRRSIYTTNSIENLNRQIRKVLKCKVSFDKIENLLDLTYMVVKDFEASNWQKYPLHRFRKWKKKTS